MTPAEIRLLFETAEPVSEDHDGTVVSPDAMAKLLEAEEVRRTAALQPVLAAVQQYWQSGSDSIDAAAEILGNGSRDAPWRVPIGRSGLLDFFLGILPTDGLRQTLKIQALRLIGNSCADEDENRARVVASSSISQIVALLQDDSLLSFVVPVLYNICVDYEPVQLQACQAQLSRALVAMVSGPRLGKCRALLSLICKTLALLVTQEQEVQQADPATAARLFQLAVDPNSALDIEEFCLLVTVALAYLAHEPFQEELIRQDGAQALLTSMAESCTKYDIAQMDPEDAQEYKSLSSGFMSAIADVVALPLFAETYPFTSQPVLTLQSWIQNSSSHTHLKATACIALGNLARSDQSSTYFVQDAKVHAPLISFLTKSGDAATPPSAQLTYAILSFLKNLAIPAANKPLLGGLLELPDPALPRIWTSGDAQPQVQFAAVSLARLLVLNCPANVKRLCSPLPPDPASPAHDRSNLNVLMSLFKRTDASHIKMEAARAVAAVCRVFHMTPDIESVLSEDWESIETTFTSVQSVSEEQTTTPPLRRARFYSVHMDIADCFTYLITQSQFPALRSEIWFVAAVMSRSADGAQVVLRCLQPFEACSALVKAVSGRELIEGRGLSGDGEASSADAQLTADSTFGAATTSSSSVSSSSATVETGIDGLGLEPQQVDPKQLASMARIDRENGLVMIAEIMKSHADLLPPFRRGVFEQLLQTGGALVLDARSEVEGESSTKEM